MKQLRRKDRAIPQEEAMAILNKAEYGVLSTVSEDRIPYGVPLNFCIIDGYIYFRLFRRMADHVSNASCLILR